VIFISPPTVVASARREATHVVTGSQLQYPARGTIEAREKHSGGDEVGRLIAVSASADAGLTKYPLEVGRLVADHGLEGDRHARGGPRQVSLLDETVAESMRAVGMPIAPGALGENLLIAGIPLDELTPGSCLRIGEAIVEITEPRRPCRNVRATDPRALKAMVGHAGQMARVVASGEVRPGDPVETIEAN
jgi:MOSC domain-containing protein YiiM